MRIPSAHEVVEYAVSIVDEHRDELGEINLTELEAEVQDHFELSDYEYDGEDYSFEIYQRLLEEGLLED